MYSLANYLIFLVALVIVSLFELDNPILVNARKLTTNHASFSVDLIRRNSSKTVLGSVSHHHHIRLSSKFYDTNSVQTEVISDGGGYAMKFSVGTPPVEFTAIADTGSDLMWVQCSPCQQCLAQQSPLFDPTKSSTNIKIPCTSQVCDADQLGLLDTGCTTNDKSCAYLEGYAGGTQTIGVLSTETITFPSPAITSYPNLLFGCGYYQEGNVGPQGDGIIGLGGGPLSLVTQIGPNINYKFSYCLTPLFSGLNSKLNFGLDVSEPGVVSTPFTSQDTHPTYYYLTLNSISIGATSVPVANNIIIDSGTTLTYLPSNVYDGVSTAMKSAIGLNPVADPGQMFDPCYESGSEGFNPPDVVFHFSGADVVLKAENSFWRTNGLTCLAMIPSDDIFIFGNVAQVNFHVGYDLKAKQVSFAPTDCSQFA